jgi:cyclohexadienyl dehydratase
VSRARKRRWPILRWLAALLLTVGLGAAESAPRFSERPEDLDQVIAIMDRRLELMPEVAAWKWHQRQPVLDAAREHAVLVQATEAAGALHLDADTARDCLAAQIRLAREVQEDRFARWQGEPTSVPPARDLATVLRPALDELGRDFLVALYLAAEGPAGAEASPIRSRLERLRRHPGIEAGTLDALAVALSRVHLVAAPSWETVRRVGVVRIGMTGDYAPFSSEREGRLAGSDVELGLAFARHWGLRAKFVRTSWPGLMDDLQRRRFDFAASGISRTPERAARADFSVAYHTDGKTPIARREDAARFASLAQIDQPGVRVIVNPGGTNERFVRDHLRQATILVHPDNRTIFAEIVARRADVMITDGTEVQLQQRRHPELVGTMPHLLTRAEKAVLLPHQSSLTPVVDAWLRPQIESGWVSAQLQRAVAVER